MRQTIAAFAEGMRTTRGRLTLARTRSLELESRRWLLAAAEAHVDAVERLAAKLDGHALASCGPAPSSGRAT